MRNIIILHVRPRIHPPCHIACAFKDISDLVPFAFSAIPIFLPFVVTNHNCEHYQQAEFGEEDIHETKVFMLAFWKVAETALSMCPPVVYTSRWCRGHLRC